MSHLKLIFHSLRVQHRMRSALNLFGHLVESESEVVKKCICGVGFCITVGSLKKLFPLLIAHIDRSISRQKSQHHKQLSQSTHQKSPKSPLGEIWPTLLTKSCRSSNSVWKILKLHSNHAVQSVTTTTFQKIQKTSKTPDF